MTDYHGLPCWYELAAKDLDGAHRFYSAVLGWSIDDSTMPGMTYHIAKAAAHRVAGLMPAQATQAPGWNLYFAVTDCDAAVKAAVARGGKVQAPPRDIPGTGRIAILIDPQGAAFCLLQPLPTDDEMSGGAFHRSLPGHGNWNELITPDPVAALRFYGELFGWTPSASLPMGPDMTYHLFAREGVDIGGTCALPGEAAHWKPYFGVTSVAAASKAVTAAGGKVVHGPDPIPGNLFTLQISDPQGVSLALVGPP